MHITAKGDYAIRAASELALRGDVSPVKSEDLADAQAIPASFLKVMLRELRQADLVHAQRGADGGYRLARPPEEITLAQVLRAVEGPLAAVRGIRPERLVYEGASAGMVEVWIAVRASIRRVLERVTLADVVAGRLPPEIAQLTDDPEAWRPH